MQQSQIVGTSILSGGCGRNILYTDIKKKGSQDRSPKNAIFRTSNTATLAVTGGDVEASVFDKLQDHLGCVTMREKSHQLAAEVAGTGKVVCSF